jgi:hypothetical protein
MLHCAGTSKHTRNCSLASTQQMLPVAVCVLHLLPLLLLVRCLSTN